MMVNAEIDKGDMHPLFLKVLLIVVVLRLALAAWLPMTGDEAYFIVWGEES